MSAPASHPSNQYSESESESESDEYTKRVMDNLKQTKAAHKQAKINAADPTNKAAQRALGIAAEDVGRAKGYVNADKILIYHLRGSTAQEKGPTDSVSAKRMYDNDVVLLAEAEIKNDKGKLEGRNIDILVKKYKINRNISFRWLTNYLIDESDGGATGRVYYAATEQQRKLIQLRSTCDVFNIPRAVWCDAEKFALMLCLENDHGATRDSFVRMYKKSLIGYLDARGFSNVTLYHQMHRLQESVVRNKSQTGSFDDGCNDNVFVDTDVVLSANIAWELNCSDCNTDEKIVAKIFKLAVRPTGEQPVLNFEGRLAYIIDRLTPNQRVLLKNYKPKPTTQNLASFIQSSLDEAALLNSFQPMNDTDAEEFAIQKQIDALTATLPSNINKRRQKDAESTTATKKKRTE